MKMAIKAALFLTIAFYSNSAFAEDVYVSDINTRLANQEKRVFEGLKSGELTLREAEKLEKEIKRIVEKRRRFLSGGTLTRAERGTLHRALDRSSRHIYEEKHDSQRR